MAFLCKLMVLVALVLMPFGMAAPAAAAEHRPASATMAHCSEEGPADQRHDSAGECTIGCAAALPAIARTGQQWLAPVAAPSLRVLAEPLTDLHPETATPPPRVA